MIPIIAGIGAAVPDGSASQAEALQFALATHHGQDDLARLLPVLYRRSGVEQRGSVLTDGQARAFFPPARDPGDRGPGTAVRLVRYAREAAPMAARAALAALDEAGASPRQVSHLVTASCTGFDAPGIDAQLIHRLGLSPEIGRIHVGFMGCHGAINALRVARALASEDPASVVLVCAVEVCSVHYHYGGDAEKLVANALFADGAAAAVVRGAAQAGDGAQRQDHAVCQLRAFGSCLLPESADAMTWRIGDHGFEMTLSPRVPDLVRSRLGPWISRWLNRHGMAIGDIRSWAVHPGGPRILTSAAEGLGLDERAMGASRRVLARHGNMSSPTVLFIVEEFRRAGDGEALWPCVMLGFGPGLVIEAALLA
jgi:predicted naringenin-chalcone synthase